MLSTIDFGENSDCSMQVWHTVNSLLHLVALALWLGSIGFFWVAFGPAAHSLNPAAGIRVLNQGRIALEGIAWAGIALLMLTGIAGLLLRSQMTAAHLGHTYMILLSVKLFFFVAMLVHHSLQVFKYGPRIAALTAAAGDQAPAWPESLRLEWRRWFTLLRLNAGLGAITVLLGVAL